MRDAHGCGRPDWHGRRHGRSLTAHRQGLLDELLPRLRVPLPAQGFVDLDRLFPHPVDDIWLEVGFGSGEHLAEQARRRPDIGFIGAEVFVNGVAALLGQIERLGLTNLRVFDDDVRLLLTRLPDACIGRMFLLFPDPWPKTRHAKRRFVGPANLPVLARLLADDAELRIATDDPGYVRWALRQMIGRPEFSWSAAGPRAWRVPPEDWVETRYQRKAVAAARRPVFLCFQRRQRRGSLENPCD